MSTPFRRLVQHFIRQISSLSDEDTNEIELGPAALLGLIATPGTIYCILLFDKYSTFLRVIRGGRLHIDVYAASVPDKYLLVACSMVLTALVVVFKWDRLLPSQSDYAVLGPLPVRLRTVCLANACAIAFLSIVFTLALNAVSGILFPLVVLSDEPSTLLELIRFLAVHTVCVWLASTFAFLCCVAVLSCCMSLLPASAFKRVSMYARLVTVAGCCYVLFGAFASPSVARNASDLVRIAWLPPAWYLGLYQCLQDRSSPGSRELAVYGLWGLAVASSVAIIGLSLSYGRYVLRVPQSSTGRTGNYFEWAQVSFNRLLLRNGFQRALYWFTIRTLLRNEAHLLVFGAFVVSGGMIAFWRFMSGTSFIEASFALVFLAASGFRVVLEIPAGARASVIYQICPINGDPKPALRKVMMTVLLWIAIPCAAAIGFRKSIAIALLHVLFICTAGTFAYDVMMLRFRKLPFWPSSTNSRNATVMVIALYILGFFGFTAAASFIETCMLKAPVSFVALPIIALLWYRAMAKEETDISVSNTDDGLAVQRLKLGL